MDFPKIKKLLEILIFFILLALFILIGRDKLAAHYYNCGMSNYETAQYQASINCFKNSLKLNPAASKTHYSLANTYAANNQEEQAIAEYKKSIQLDRHFILAYEALVDMHLRKKAYQEASNILKDAKASLPESREIRDLENLVSFKQVAHFINNGMDAFSTGETSKGYELLNKALQIKPDFVPIYYTLGYFYYVENKYAAALSMLNKALSLDNKFALTHRLLGDIYFSQGAFDKAVIEYKKAISLEDGGPVLFNNLGLAFMNLEDYQEAGKFLKKALDLNPSNINFRYNLASVYRDAGRTDEAFVEYTQIIKKQLNYLNVHNDLGDIYKQRKQNDLALKEYQKEVNFGQIKLLERRDDPVLLSIIAYAYNGLGQYAKAKELIGRALAIDPDCREAHLTYASIQNNLGERQKALLSLEKAKKLSSRRQIFIEQKVDDIKKEINSIAKVEAGFSPTDVIYLKSGRYFEGIITERTKDRITLKINVGNSVGSVTLFKDDIERIQSKE